MVKPVFYSRAFVYLLAFSFCVMPFRGQAQEGNINLELSLDSAQESALFEVQQIEDLERALRVYELNEDIDISDIVPASSLEPLGELEPLPSFYFSSLIYRNSRDWKVWINGKAYVSGNKSNVTEGAEQEDISVSLLSKNRIRVSWKVGKFLPQALDAWKVRNDQTLNKPYSHRLSKNQGAKSFDLSEGVLSFTLQPNQTFIVDYFDVVEGEYAHDSSVNLVTIGGARPMPGNNSQPEAPGNVVDSLINSVMPKDPAQGGSGAPGNDGGQLEALQKEILRTIFAQ